MLGLSNKNTIAHTRTDGSGVVCRLSDEDKSEVLNFLSVRPLHTFVMTGWIQDNGIASQFNRGTFYGYRDLTGRLSGVALIGHVTLFETDSDHAMSSFASLTKNCPGANVVMGEERKVMRFLSHYRSCEQTPPRLICRESLFEQRRQREMGPELTELRLAAADEIDVVTNAHAEMIIEQSGLDPRKADANGFRERCARRVTQGRVWVWMKGGQLIFKADVISDLSEVAYLEGVYVDPAQRGRGLGSRCVQQLTNMLLRRTKSVCLLAKEQNSAAKSCYQKAGYSFRDYYETLYLAKPAFDKELTVRVNGIAQQQT